MTTELTKRDFEEAAWIVLFRAMESVAHVLRCRQLGIADGVWTRTLPRDATLSLKLWKAAG